MSNLAVLGGAKIGDLNVPKWPIYDEREEKAIIEVLRSGKWAYRGPAELDFERAFAEYTDAKYAVAVTNGTHTLRLLMEAYNIGPGDEVIVPGITWQATAATVLDVNAVPILVDIDEDNFNIDPKAIEAAITSRTRAIMPVHLYGRMCDMDAIMDIAARYNLIVIEDCAHQHGSRWRGVNAGLIGNAGSYSLQGSKVLNTGEGGLITTNDDNIHDLVQSLKNCGRASGESGLAMQSGNYRMTDFQSAIGLVQLSRLHEQDLIRDKNAKKLESSLTNISGLKPQVQNPNVTFQTYYMWTLAYDKEQWRNVSKWGFIGALKAEVSDAFHVGSTYVPLHRSNLYRPLSKKTHRLNEDYVNAINPSRFNLPVCDRVFEDVAICIGQPALLMDDSGIDKLVDIFNKLWDNIDELKIFDKDYVHVYQD